MDTVTPLASAESLPAIQPQTSDPAILVIHNPVAGFWQRNKLRLYLKALRDTGRRVIVRKTAGPGDATFIAAEVDPRQVETVVAAGGDGTIREVADGLAGSGVRLAVLPLGTANVLALELGLGLSPRAAARATANAHEGTGFAGLVDNRRFLLMVSAGIDARVVSRTSTKLKRYIGKSAYAVAAVQELLRPKWGGPITALVDGEEISGDLIIVTRAQRYAGPFIIAPNADIRGRRLFIVAPQGRGFWAMIRYAGALFTNRLATLPDVIVREAREVVLTGPQGHPIQVDGDAMGTLPVTIRCDEAPITLLWPKEGA
ncbi:diacylglycerol/lipid kinase family protein [Hwanghaeella sp.]|uniref:diacylglycerol/lipid kinase family protein n=1 Tax=Hwanghaeella sp. TaxID=2605943 RepID=UPI003CCB799B